MYDGTITIDYSNLNSVVKYSKTIHQELDDYKDKISKSVVSKCNESNLAGSDSQGYVSAATAAANKKIKALEAQSDKAKTFSNKLDTFVTNAKNADKMTAKNIGDLGAAAVGKRTFIQKCGDFLYNTFCVDLANLPINRCFANANKWVSSRLSSLHTKISKWYREKGGKYILRSILIGVAAVAALIGAVVAIATAGTALAIAAAICGLIAAVIGVANGIMAIASNIKAKKLHDEGKLGQARYHGNIDSVSSFIDRTDLGDAKTNKTWHNIGVGIDVVDTVASIGSLLLGGADKLFGVKDPYSGKITSHKFSWDTMKKNVKSTFGVNRQRYMIDKKTGKAIPYNGQKSGYKVGDRFSFKNLFSSRSVGTDKQYVRKYFGFGATDQMFYPAKSSKDAGELFKGLSTGKKVAKTTMDTIVVVDKTAGRIEKANDIWRLIRGKDSIKTAKDVISVSKKVTSGIDFLKPAAELGKYLSLLDEGVDFYEIATN